MNYFAGDFFSSIFSALSGDLLILNVQLIGSSEHYRRLVESGLHGQVIGWTLFLENFWYQHLQNFLFDYNPQRRLCQLPGLAAQLWEPSGCEKGRGLNIQHANALLFHCFQSGAHLSTLPCVPQFRDPLSLFPQVKLQASTTWKKNSGERPWGANCFLNILSTNFLLFASPSLSL